MGYRYLQEKLKEIISLVQILCIVTQENYPKKMNARFLSKIGQSCLEIGAPCAIPIPHTVNCTSIVRGHSDVATLNRDLGFDFNVLPHRSTAS